MKWFTYGNHMVMPYLFVFLWKTCLIKSVYDHLKFGGVVELFQTLVILRSAAVQAKQSLATSFVCI